MSNTSQLSSNHEAAAPLVADLDGSPRHRSGAVARMLRMPVATLRVWERRYGVASPAVSPSGQRLYTADDVRRLAVLKRLTDLGHAIGSLARLDMQQLQQVASTHASVLASRYTDDPAPANEARLQALRVAVVGSALGLRVKRPSLVKLLARPVQWIGPYADMAQAAAALQSGAIDALLVHEPRLHEGWAATVRDSAPTLGKVPTAVLYRFAAESTCTELASAGIALLREPQSDSAVAQWLQGVLQAVPQVRAPVPDTPTADAVVPPRRWDDAALVDFASLSSTIACECPRHVAELLMQLSHFEAYSAECVSRDAADAELHTYLRQVSTAARASFEQALEHLALHEGLLLPPSNAK